MTAILQNEETFDFWLFDNVISEQYTHPANVTEYPIDRRSPVTDHRQRQQKSISLTLLVTGTPYATNPLNSEQGTGYERIQNVRDWLEDNQDSSFSYAGVRFPLIENLLIQEFSYSVDSRLELRIDMSLRQVEFGEAQVVELPPERIQKQTLKPESENAKNGETKGVDPDEGRRKSILKFLTGDNPDPTDLF